MAPLFSIYTIIRARLDEFKELLNLFNATSLQMQYVVEVDEIIHMIVSGEVPTVELNALTVYPVVEECVNELVVVENVETYGDN